MGVAGQMPGAVDVIMTSKDGTRHKLRVAIPAPSHVGPDGPAVYLVIKSSDEVVTSETDPELQWR